MPRADAKVGHPARPVRLVRRLGYHHLRRAGTRTSAPSARNCTASPTSGSTSPRDPYVDKNTRTSRLPFPSISGLGRRFCGKTRALPQAPRCAIR